MAQSEIADVTRVLQALVDAHGHRKVSAGQIALYAERLSAYELEIVQRAVDFEIEHTENWPSLSRLLKRCSDVYHQREQARTMKRHGQGLDKPPPVGWGNRVADWIKGGCNGPAPEAIETANDYEEI